MIMLRAIVLLYTPSLSIEYLLMVITAAGTAIAATSTTAATTVSNTTVGIASKSSRILMAVAPLRPTAMGANCSCYHQANSLSSKVRRRGPLLPALRKKTDGKWTVEGDILINVPRSV